MIKKIDRLTVAVRSVPRCCLPLLGLPKFWLPLFWLPLLGLPLFGLTPAGVAQVIPDRTLSNNTRVTPSGNTLFIEDGTRAGSHLFHSFEQFSPNAGTTAYFNNALDVQTIFSRVTGRLVSRIDGSIQANGTANLFLLNPNGIIFGPNASLNIGGSFFATTADRVIFTDGSFFSASQPQDAPLLSLNVPIGLGFGANPGSIVNQSSVTSPGLGGTPTPTGLQVSPGQAIALIGGDIFLDSGYLTAPSGRIEMGSVDGQNQVSIAPSGSSYTFGYEGIQHFRDITLTNLATVDTSGLGGGEIFIQGHNIILNEGAKITSYTLGAENGIGIRVNAFNSIQVIGTTSIPLLYEPFETAFDIFVPIRSAINTNTFGDGNAGSITINARQVSLIGGGQINASAFGQLGNNLSSRGNGGDLTIHAFDLVEVIGITPVEGTGDPFNLGPLGTEINGASAIGTVTGTLGEAGNLTISTGRLIVSEGGIITSNTFASGSAGDVAIDAREFIEVSRTSISGVVPSVITSSSVDNGDTGDIIITTGRLTLLDGGRITSNATDGSRAGVLDIHASDSVIVRGVSPIDPEQDEVAISNSALFAGSLGRGNAGDLNVTTDGRLEVSDGAQITVDSREGQAGNLTIDADTVHLDRSRLTASTASGSGNGGDLLIETGQLDALNESAIAVNSRGGQAGNLTIDADTVRLDQSTLTASTQSARENGGDLSITTNQLNVTNQSRIAVNNREGQAGNLTINADTVRLDQSTLTASTQSARENGGGLSITTNQLNVTNALIAVNNQEGRAGDLEINADTVRLNRGWLLASTPAGRGGNITLQVADLFILRNRSLVSANAGEEGQGGNVTIGADFIAAISSEDSDIIANAEAGRGGEISITTQGIFGLTRRSDRTQFSDITASSDSGGDGVIEITTLDVDPNRGLVELPTTVIDASRLIARDCSAQGNNVARSGSTFVNTGRGGVPVHPSDPLLGESIFSEWAITSNMTGSTQTMPPMTTLPATADPLLEAQGWRVGEDGTVMLTAEATNATPHASAIATTTCSSMN